MAQQELCSEAKQPQLTITKNDKTLEQTRKLPNYFCLKGAINFMYLNFENKNCVYDKCLFFIKVIRDMRTGALL